MYKYIISVFTCDKSVTFSLIKPFYRSCCHNRNPFHKQVKNIKPQPVSRLYCSGYYKFAD